MFQQENNTRFTPIVGHWISEFLKNKKDIFNLLHKHGSSIEILYPYLFLENQAAFTEILNKYSLSYQMLFPRRASLCRRFGKLASGNGIGAVVESMEELLACLDEYDNSDQILVSPKNHSVGLVQLAVQKELCLVVSRIEDIHFIQKISLNLNKTAKIGIRLGSFVSKGDPVGEQKGFCPNEAYHMITTKFGKSWSKLNFFGFHFQMDEFCIGKKSEALRQTLVIVELLRRKGIKTNYIDLGDVFPVNYLAKQKDWGNFHKVLKNASNQNGQTKSGNDSETKSFWKANIQNDEIKMYPYYNKFPKEAFLEKVLLQPFSMHELLFQAIRSRDIHLIVQPGRALLDQTGLSLACISIVKENLQGEVEIVLEMNQNQLNRLKTDYLLDPIYISKEDDYVSTQKVGYLIGQCGGQQELILKRKINFPKKPVVGDAICFVNTAGFNMHLNDPQNDAGVDSKNIFISESENRWLYELEAC